MSSFNRLIKINGRPLDIPFYEIFIFSNVDDYCFNFLIAYDNVFSGIIDMTIKTYRKRHKIQIKKYNESIR